MKIFPAIDLLEGCAVRLLRGAYDEVTVYSRDPVAVARAFADEGASHLHLVDLEGARYGTTPNFDLVRRIKKQTTLFTEIGGGIRSMDTLERYFDVGVDRCILGTAAVADDAFLRCALARYGERMAVGVDLKDGRVATNGWETTTDRTADEFLSYLSKLGVRTVICTDISRDGAMRGANRRMYVDMSRTYSFDIVASGGVSSMEDVRALADMNLYGAIIGRAYYTGAIALREAVDYAERGQKC